MSLQALPQPRLVFCGVRRGEQSENKVATFCDPKGPGVPLRAPMIETINLTKKYGDLVAQQPESPISERRLLQIHCPTARATTTRDPGDAAAQ